MFIERSLQYMLEENDKLFAKSTTAVRAAKFMEVHPTAKIVVIVDTHAADNGYFVWVGDTPDDFRSCSLLEVGVACYRTRFMLSPPPQILQDCSPKEIFKYLSISDDAPSHHHKTLIVNLACGDSISLPRPRSELLAG